MIAIPSPARLHWTLARKATARDRHHSRSRVDGVQVVRSQPTRIAMKKLFVIAAVALGVAVGMTATVVVPAAAALAAFDDCN